MNVLFIGGTGLISIACSELALQRGHNLTLLNRSASPKHAAPQGATVLTADIHGDEAQLKKLLADLHFDVVVDWIAFTPEDVERDIRLFRGKTDQFIFISSASAYQKPPANYIITEETPLHNPYWQYSRDKIACEVRLMSEHRQRDFPVTIIRPSLTYGLSQIPLAVGSWQMPYTIVDRIRRGKKLIVPGDGTSLWVMTWNEDFAKGLVGLFGCKAAIGQAFHITSDEALTWNQLYSEVFRALGVEPNLVHIPSDLLAAYDDHATGSLIGDKANSAVFDNRKIKQFVRDFSCEVRWADGIRRAIAWHEADPARQAIDPSANERWDRIIDAYEKAFPGGRYP